MVTAKIMRAGAHLPPPTGPQTVITHDYHLPPPSDDAIYNSYSSSITEHTPSDEPEVSFYDTDNNLLVLGERYIYTTVSNRYIGTYYDRVPHLIMFNNISRYPSDGLYRIGRLGCEPVPQGHADFNSANLFTSVVPSVHVIGDDVPIIPLSVSPALSPALSPSFSPLYASPVAPPIIDDGGRAMVIGSRYTFTMGLSVSGFSFLGTYAGSPESSIITFSDLLMLPDFDRMDQSINIEYDANNPPILYLQTGMKSRKRRRRRETKSKKRNPRTKNNKNKKKKKSNKKKNKRLID